MAAALINFVSQFLSLSWLTGPIFDKELRVSSRRRRNYVLRFAYLALLTIFLVFIWLNEVRYLGSAAYRISRMARAGQTITLFIVWFQFCATQLIAIIMLSTSISDEIDNRTLGLLMTTPINSFQIVMGKLFSKLLQIILLLAISLPLLAIVRIFGGVPWDYIISSLCITLAAIIFVSSLSMFFSIYFRKAYVVIIMTILSLGVLFALLPFLCFMMFKDMMLDNKLISIIFQANPYGIMTFNTVVMENPRSLGGMFYSWPLHCAIMLVSSGVLLSVSIIKVRKVALCQATGQLDRFFRKKPTKGAIESKPNTSAIRTVGRLAFLWKELRSPLFGRSKIIAIIVISTSLILLLITYVLIAIENGLDDTEVQASYLAILGCVGMLFAIVLPATCITSEKESRCWPLILTTTLSDWQILLGKIIGTLRRCAPAWFLMFGHLIVFTFIGFIHPIALIHIPVLVAWVIVFFLGTGVYFSSRFKHTTTAVIMNFTFAAVIWGLVPLLMFLFAVMTDTSDNYAESYMNINPLFQGAVVLDGTCGSRHARRSVTKLRYHWARGRGNAVESTDFLLSSMLGYMLIGSLFAWRAKCRFRRNIF
jgi:ABC-type transport system involved in multi-copper enzyme maturation permease subunit